MKRFLKWAGIIILIPVSLFILLSILLYTPPIQNLVVSKCTSIASKATGMDINIGRVSLSFPLDLLVHRTTVVQDKDTVVNVNRLKVEVQFWPLLKKQVEIDGLVLEDAQVNTQDLIEGMSLKGKMKRFYVESHGVNLNPELAVINTVELYDTQLDIALTDTTATDTTASEPLFWKIILEKANFNNVSLSLNMPLDTMEMNLTLSKANLREGFVDLHKSMYSLNKLHIKNGAAGYITGTLPAEGETSGFNPSNIQLTNITVGMDSIHYEGDNIRADINNFILKERSGLEIVGTKGQLIANEKRISIPTFDVRTSTSHLKMDASADWGLSSFNQNGKIKANLLASISKNDLVKIIPELSEDFKKDFPEQPVHFQAEVNGSLNQLNLNALDLEISDHLKMTIQGTMHYPTDSLRRYAYVYLKSEFHNLSFFKSYLGDAFIPLETSIEGFAEMNKDTLKSDLSLLTPSAGSISLKGNYNLTSEAYSTDFFIDNLDLHSFLPKDSLYHLTASVKAAGQGIDFFSPQTVLKADGGIPHFQYGKKVFSGVKLAVDLKDSKAKADLNVKDLYMDIYNHIDAHLNPQKVTVQLNSNIKRLDLQSLGLTSIPYRTSHNILLDVQTDMQQRHTLHADIANNQFTVNGKSFKSKDLKLGLNMSADSIQSFAKAGDLNLQFFCKNGLDSLLAKIDKVSSMISSQLEAHALDQELIRQHLPDAHLRIRAGHDNPINNLMEANGIGFKGMSFQINASPTAGLASDGRIYKLHTDSLTLDTLCFNAKQVAKELLIKGTVIANRSKKQEGFNINLTGKTGERNIECIVEYLNEKKERGAYIGVNTQLEKEGISLHLIPEKPTLVYRPFHLNEKNYIYINKEGRIHADLSLHDNNNSGMHIFSTPDSTVQQDLTLALNQIDIAELKRIVPYMPDIAGIINAEAHYVQPYNDILLASIEASVDQLAYNKEPMGDWAMSAVYLPKEKKEQCIDGYITRNGEAIADISGSYFSTLENTEQDWLNAKVSLHHFPLNLGNAFVSKSLAVLHGSIDGEMAIKGPTAKPVVNGKMMMDTVSVFIPQASMNLRFEQRPIKISNSQLKFDKFKIYTLGKSPFVIDGDIDFADFDAVMLNLTMIATDFELINGKRTKESLVYGKLYIDLASSIKGTPDNLKVRGSANILGKSDFTYVLKDSPLTVEDRLGETVTFVNFSDTTHASRKNIQSVSLGGIDMLMALHIDQAVQGKVDLNASGSNYMIVEGGGDLSFKYTPEGKMYMNGRYSLMSGEMKYEMPVIPLKTFKIQNGSYIEWTGNVMNPALNIKAFEKVRASVSEDGKNSRMVTFNVGVKLTNRLNNLGFTFTLEAPEDGSVQEELASMSDEEKNKLAVTMLVTGLYIAESNSAGGLDANGALNSYLQGQINNIAGSALKTIDVNIGMEKNDQGENGQSGTDYNFQFAKRFWNNRFRVIIGGKISTGNNANQSDSFIDNVSLEYRLDNSGTRYVKIFHDKKYASVLEGEVIETGAGIVLRKKVSRIGELFIFKKNKKKKAEKEDKKDKKKDGKKNKK